MKIKLLPLVALTIGLVSCGNAEEADYDEEDDSIEAVENLESDTIQPFNGTITEGITGELTPDASDPNTLSTIFGGLLANQFKNQGLNFLDPDQFITDFKKYRTEQKTELDMQEIGARLQALADSTQRFKIMTDEDKKEGRYLFPQLFYADFGKSPLFKALVLAKFDEAFLKAWKENITASQAEVMAFETYRKQMEAKINEEKFGAVKKEGQDWLAANATKPGVKTTSSGLQYKVIKEGTGEKPSASNQVEVHYEGKLLNGQIFDSSYKRGQTITFALTQVIKGWTEGLQLMTPGSTYELYIPYDLAYGPQGSPPKIPPYSALIFKVELVSVK